LADPIDFPQQRESRDTRNEQSDHDQHKSDPNFGKHLHRINFKRGLRKAQNYIEPIIRPRLSVLCGEFLGTGLLVLGGCGFSVINELYGAPIDLYGISAGWGLWVAALVFAFGDISGAHINPAVTLGFAVGGRFSWRQVPGYLGAQLAGAAAGAGLLRLLFPTAITLGQTNPQGSVGQTFGIEVAITFTLMLVVLQIATGAKEKGATAGLAVGFTVLAMVLFAGPVSMASLNPARSFGPALVAGDLTHLWIYLTAPVLGAILAVGADKLLHAPEEEPGLA